MSFEKREPLEQPEIDGRAVRTKELAPQGLAERAVRVDGKRGRVEPDTVCGRSPTGGSNGWPVRIARLLPNPQPALSTPLVMVYGWPLCHW